MKRKRPVPATPVPNSAASAPAAPTKEHLMFDRLFVVGFSVLLFFAMTVQTKLMALILAGLGIISLFGRGPLTNFRQRLSIPVTGLLLFALVGGCAGLYSNFGSYALKEYVKLLASLSLAVILLARGKKGHVQGLLWGFATVSSVISLLSIDAAGASALYGAFRALAGALGDSSYATMGSMASAARINGIYNDANITASIFALGIIIALYLSCNVSKTKEKFAAMLLLGVQSMGFFLSLSRGAILCFGAALLVYLAFCGKDVRLRLFFLMVEAALVTVILSFPAIRFIASASVMPTILAIACGALIFALDWGIGQRAVSKLTGHGKAVAGVCGGILLACVAYVLIALQITGSLAIPAGGLVDRSISLSPGDYTTSGDWDSGVTLTVNAQNEQEILTNTRTQLYTGPLDGASFAVPDGTSSVQFVFGSESEAEIRSVQLSDGTELALNYPLLPSFITTRLQSSLFGDYSFYLRVQFMIDAGTLFMESPIMGHGLGSTEALYTAVQPFFYESLYVHNHILQVMDDMGLLGLIPFLMFLGGAIWLLVRRLRQSADPLAATLIACWAMMNLHGLMEINFSIRAYQCAAFSLLILVVILYGKSPKAKRTFSGGAALIGTGIYLLVFGGLLVCNLAAVNIYYEATNNPNITQSEFIHAAERADALDFYEDQSYKVNLMGNALQAGGVSNEGTAARCARELRETGDYDACYYVAAYYYLPLGRLDDFFDVLQEGLLQERSNSDAWNSAMNLCSQAFDLIDPADVDVYADGVREIGASMDETNAELLVPVTLTEENAALLNSVQSESLTGEALYIAISTVLAQAES